MWCSLHWQVAEGRKNLEIRRVDRAQLLDKCGLRALPYSTSGEASCMGKSLGCSLKFDYGLLHTRGLQLLSHHGKGNHPCPLCDIAPWRTQ